MSEAEMEATLRLLEPAKAEEKPEKENGPVKTTKIKSMRRLKTVPEGRKS